jgi:hypothetical protein
MYLSWANRMFLAFFPFNGISNLRAFNVAFSSIPTASTKTIHLRRLTEAFNAN